MAEHTGNSGELPAHSGDGWGVEQLKTELEGYRELLLPLKRLLEWEQNWYPAALVGVITFFFAIVWYIEPSVLTSFALLSALVCIVDFALPTISAQLFRSNEWTVVQDREYAAICERISHMKQHCGAFCKYFKELRSEKPKAYMVVLIGTFLVLAWLGSLIDNLLLIYLLVVVMAMVPGLRKRGILQIVTDKIKMAAQQLKKSGQERLNKNKTN